MLGHAPFGGAPLGARGLFGFPDDFDILLTESVGFGTTLIPLSNSRVSVTESLRIGAIMVGARGLYETVDEGIEFSTDLALMFAIAMVERVRVGDVQIPNLIMCVTNEETVAVSDKLYQAMTLLITESLGVADMQLVQAAVTIFERIQVQPQLAARAVYHITVTQAFRLRDSLASFYGADIVDGIGFAADLSARAMAMAAVSETVGVAGQITPQLLLNVRVSEGIGIEPTQVLNMIYNASLRDGVEISAAYVAPDGSFTAWSMNTRTAAVTEYSDFVFNSFARMGNRYIGASDDGLYELLGDDDEGEDIIARIKGGYMQFGGTHLSRLKAVYIAARGEGEMILKIIEAEDKVYVYRADTRNVRNTKVHMGKGQKSRYFAFELITDGQDFDLDTLEFVPIVVPRRV